MATFSKLLDAPAVSQTDLVAVATVEQLLVLVIEAAEHGIVAGHEAAEGTVMEVLWGFVGLSFLFSEVVEQGCGGVFVGFEAGEINRFLCRFPGLSVHDVQEDCAAVLIF